MKRVLIVTFSMMLIGISSMSFAQNAIQNNQTQQVQVEVDGLSCPFCAYGLEKKLSGIDGVASIKIDIDQGMAILTISENKIITEEEIRKVVKQAGFTPKKIVFANLPAKKDNENDDS
ncbi:MAG: heavy-metal-associated domain-containing protein [Bacteroidetes bacterium]|nr:heavy-metal-associated domain-containing protein [Bacteroidota bacterium]